MSAPTVERTWQTTTRGAAVPAQRTSSPAIGRAYARKAGRQQRASRPAGAEEVNRPRFVLMVMGLLGAGLVASLWLSTSAAADSYRLEQATRTTRELSERSETLRTEIAAMRTAPALAQSARALGMVPVSDVARLVPEPNGSVAIVGTPKAGLAPAPPPLPEGVLPPSAVPGQTPGAVPGQTAGVVPGQQAVVPGQPDVVPAQPATAGQRARLAAGQQPGTSGAPVTGQRVQLAAQQSPAAATPRIARR